jgi:hypothetical protein
MRAHESWRSSAQMQLTFSFDWQLKYSHDDHEKCSVARTLYIYSLALSYMRLLSKRYGLKENPKQFNCIDYSPKLYEYLI